MNVFDAILPVLFLALSGLILLMIGSFVRRVSNFGMIFAAVGALVITGRFVFFAPNETVLHGMVVIGQFTRFADLLVLVAAAGALILTTDYNETTGIVRFEYPVLVLFAVTGMLVMVSAGDLLALYIGFEIQSITLYVLAAFARNSIRSSEAGLKYFVIGSLSSGLLLFGISLVYGFAGTTAFSGIAKTLTVHSPEQMGSAVGLVFVLVGLAYKISAAPFHMWTPDVYEGSPSSVTALFATAPKVAAFALLLRVMLGPFGNVVIEWQNLVQILAAVSMVIGALGAIGQTNIKRLMAYSSIGHMGYALLGLAAGTEAGVSATLIYLAIYVVMSLGAFGCIIAMRRGGRNVERIDDLAGMANEDGRFALALAIFMWSMAGIPPLAGFFGKLYVFAAAIRANLDGLAVLGVITSAAAAFYYLRVIKVMYFDTGRPGFDRRAVGVDVVIAGSAFLTTVFVFDPAPLAAAATAAAQALLPMIGH